jgi:hypothetical protein
MSAVLPARSFVVMSNSQGVEANEIWPQGSTPGTLHIPQQALLK